MILQPQFVMPQQAGSTDLGVEFNTGHASCGDLTLFDNATTFSASFWLRYNSIPPVQHRIISKWAATTEFLIAYRPDLSSIFFALSETATYNSGTSTIRKISFTPTAGQLYHFVFSWGGGSDFTAYKDGVPQTVVLHGGAISIDSIYPGNTDLTIGGDADYSHQIDLADVRLYKRALLQSNVDALYAGRNETIEQSNLELWLKMNEGPLGATATTIADHSTNGNDATATGSAEYVTL